MKVAGVVAALDAEARTLGPLHRRSDGLFASHDGALVAVSGMGCTAAAIAARALIEAGAGALISWGMAGGLDPALSAGTLCVPEGVISPEGVTLDTDVHWRELWVAAIAARYRVVGGLLLTRLRAIDAAAAKAAAFRDTAAAAVDMESSAVAQIAAAHGLPFIAVRAIVDTADDDVPQTVLAAGSSGQVRVTRLVGGLVRSPRDLFPVLKLAKRYRAATRVLAAAAHSGALAPLTFAAAPAARIA